MRRVCAKGHSKQQPGTAWDCLVQPGGSCPAESTVVLIKICAKRHFRQQIRGNDSSNVSSQGHLQVRRPADKPGGCSRYVALAPPTCELIRVTCRCDAQANQAIRGSSNMSAQGHLLVRPRNKAAGDTWRWLLRRASSSAQGHVLHCSLRARPHILLSQGHSTGCVQGPCVLHCSLRARPQILVSQGHSTRCVQGLCVLHCSLRARPQILLSQGHSTGCVQGLCVLPAIQSESLCRQHLPGVISFSAHYLHGFGAALLPPWSRRALWQPFSGNSLQPRLQGGSSGAIAAQVARSPPWGSGAPQQNQGSDSNRKARSENLAELPPLSYSRVVFFSCIFCKSLEHPPWGSRAKGE